jgi:pimeloyl-ACP methyl ester carboxylesterase
VIGASFGLLYVFLLLRSFFTDTLADSARYFRAVPENVDARREIRRQGVEFVRRIHMSRKNYDRVIIVGHSLGSVIGYGIISQYWGLVRDLLAKQQSIGRALENVEDASAPLWLVWRDYWTKRLALGKKRLGKIVALDRRLKQDVAPLGAAFEDARAGYFAEVARKTAKIPTADRNPNPELRDEDNKYHPWLISDFITIGCPLTYASFLTADSEEQFWNLIDAKRRHPSVPPAMNENEGLDGVRKLRFSYPSLQTREQGAKMAMAPHSATPFAATRWTNLYFEHSNAWGLPLNGDIIGGPLGPVLGPGVIDIRLPIGRHLKAEKGFQHNNYWIWSAPKGVVVDASNKHVPDHIYALRRAMSLFTTSDDPRTSRALYAMEDGKRPPDDMH